MLSRSITRGSRLRCQCYATSASTSPPLLLKIRKDMKSAMQAKDTNRLSVLRSLLTATLNASKTSTPINTDMQVLALLRKSANASRAASEEFRSAGRSDLAKNEDSQIAIMEEYAASVEVMSPEEIEQTVRGIVSSLKAEGASLQMGEVLKKTFGPDGLGDGNVDKGEVAKLVKTVLAEK